jgi:hypothetical protein
MLLAEPTYNRTRPIALAWRARILSQKALRNVSRITFSSAFWPPSQKSEERAHSSPALVPRLSCLAESVKLLAALPEALVAGQLAELTRTVGDIAQQLEGLREGASDAQERADTHQERIDLAARELGSPSKPLVGGRIPPGA